MKISICTLFCAIAVAQAQLNLIGDFIQPIRHLVNNVQGADNTLRGYLGGLFGNGIGGNGVDPQANPGYGTGQKSGPLNKGNLLQYNKRAVDASTLSRRALGVDYGGSSKYVSGGQK